MRAANATPVAVIANEAYGNAQSPAWKSGNFGPRGDQALFFHAWLRQPAIIGAIMPTRLPLARAMARAVTGNRPVVELGGGTGPITRALVESGIEPARLTVIERNPVFHSLLMDRFPSFRILCGDAKNLSNILSPAEMGQVGAVVSSLPRVGWPLACQRSILEQCFAALRGDGVFLEFSYGPLSPIPRRLLRELGLAASRLQRVWGNFPPATVWEYRRVAYKSRPNPNQHMQGQGASSEQLGAHKLGAVRCLPRINLANVHRSDTTLGKTHSAIFGNHA